MIKVPGIGPAKADIVIVGEAPGLDEEIQGTPFVGASGNELTRLLREAGIDRSKCYVTNVCKYRPPGNDMSKWLTDKKRAGLANEWEERNGRYAHDLVIDGADELLREIESHEPRIVVGFGNTPLWALTGQWGITDWRGSEMHVDVAGRSIPFVPTLHPASILRSWSSRPFVVHDLKARVARRLREGFVTPEWDFNWAPTYEDVGHFLEGLRGDVAVDVETSRGQIVCIGIATSARKAMCIPFISEGYGAYWPAQAQKSIIALLQIVLTSPKVNIIGQNFNYDASYFDDNFDFLPRVAFDTLIAQSVLFPGTPRGLGYLSSMHCDWHCYWKDDARDWSNLRDFDRLFQYNCRDVCATWEAAQSQRVALQKAGLMDQFNDRMTYNHHVFDMMKRGVIRDEATAQAMEGEIEEALHARKIVICNAAGREINPNSPVQVEKWLYDEAGCRRPARRGKTAGGTGDEEIKQLINWHPELEEALTAVLEFRSLGSVRNNVLNAKLDPDGRLRSSFMTTGTETFRLTSSKNNFGRGCNMLNITTGNDDEGGSMPNFRKLFVAPSGHTLFDCDLARADVWIVAAEANDAYLMEKLKAEDVHYENAKDVYGVSAPSKAQRRATKTFVHLTNYGGSARTAAIAAGTTVHEADMAQRRWFAAHPGIKDWHKRYEAQLKATRMIRNAFGYRCVYFDRIEGLLKEALAWTPQSTVAIVASKIHMAFDAIPGVSVFVQMYDSVAGYYPTVEEERILAAMKTAKDIVVPYEQPLIIPMGLSTSTKSWGHCKDKESEREWPT